MAGDSVRLAKALGNAGRIGGTRELRHWLRKPDGTRVYFREIGPWVAVCNPAGERLSPVMGKAEARDEYKRYLRCGWQPAAE
jgi:hypothetical protein